MSSLATELEDLGYWPVCVELRARRVYTLWGAGFGDVDRFAAHAGRLCFVVALRDLPALVARSDNLDVARSLAGPESAMRWAQIRDVTTVRLDHVAKRLRGLDALGEADRNEALLLLNFLWDAAATVGVDPATLGLHASGSLGRVADHLSFPEVRDLVGVLPFEVPATNRKDIQSALSRALHAASQRADVLEDECWRPMRCRFSG